MLQPVVDSPPHGPNPLTHFPELRQPAGSRFGVGQNGGDDARPVCRGIAVVGSHSGHQLAGDPVAFIKTFNGRISSVHLKDRTTPANGQHNLPWGTGNTPLKEILLTMRRDKHTYPAAIELEYEVPAGSDAVRETVKCLDFCKAALSNT